MARVHGLSHRQVDHLIQEVETAAVGALRLAVEGVRTALLNTVTAAVGDEPPAPPALVSLDNLGAIQTVWSAQVTDVLGPLVQAAFGQGADAVGVGLAESFQGFEVPAVASQLSEAHVAEAVNRMKNTGNVVWEQTRNQLLDGIKAGESIDHISARLETVVGMTESDATRVARTEIISATNAGSMAMAETTGLDMEKVWIATEDMRTRPAHRQADGQTRALAAPFDVGGFALQYPGDPAGPAGEVINCRCTQGYDVPPDQPALSDRPAEPVPDVPAETTPPSPPAPVKKTPRSKPATSAAAPEPVPTVDDVPTGAYADLDAASAQKMQDELRPWTKAQRDSLEYYTGGDYVGMNAFLRTGEDVPAKIKKYVANAQAAMRPSTRPVVLYRGTKASQFGLGDQASLADLKKLVGKTMEDKGFMSTSVGTGNAFQSRVLLQIEAPAGTPMAFVKSVSYVKNEDEMLLAAGTRYKVVSVVKKANQVVVRVRVTA